MGLLEKIGDDMKVAMKQGQKLRLETLRTIRAQLLEKQVERRPTGGGITPEDEIGVLNSASKKRKEAIAIYRTNNRNDLADQETKELEIIQEYLPKQISETEIETVVEKYVTATGASAAEDFGKVMPLIMKELKGKADGKLVQEILRKSLGKGKV
jgi:uncharacterized protein YqeY